MRSSLRILVSRSFWYLPLLISILLAYYCVGQTSFDSGKYIKNAFQFANGNIDLSSRPGFIFLLGSAFKIFEPSLWLATELVRLFYVANVFIIFFIAKYLYKPENCFCSRNNFASLLFSELFFTPYSFG